MFIYNDSVGVPTCICPMKESIGIKNKVNGNFILDLWNSEYMIQYRKKILNCSYFNFCNSDCINNNNRDTFKSSVKY